MKYPSDAKVSAVAGRGGSGPRAIGDVATPEFRLIAACCRWPPSAHRNMAIRDAADNLSDWDRLLWLANRHRVAGLVHEALASAESKLPATVAEALAARAQRIARRNLLLLTETVRVQGVLETAGIPCLMLKGVGLAQLAYGSLSTKDTRDIDLLVPPDHAEAALHIIKREGYRLVAPAEHLSETQRRAVVRYAKDVEFTHHDHKLPLDLQWRTARNRLLLKGVDALSPTQNVPLSGDVSVRTLAQDDLFAYLCVHGASHAWSRLKWLADLNALIASNNADLTHLYRHAQLRGAGLCSGQALLLCQRLFGLRLPAAVAAELDRNKRVKKLAAIAQEAMIAPRSTGRSMADVSDNVRLQFLLGQGWPFFAAQCGVMSVGVHDIVALPLPQALHFLYPALRVPLWLWRRAKSNAVAGG